MATVYYVRDGSGDGTGDGRTSEGREIPLRAIFKAFPNAKTVWLEGTPTINPKASVNPFSGFRHVILHVQGGEVAGKISKDGYWILDGISPTNFEQIFPSK